MKQQQFRNIDDYISSFPDELREVLEQIRLTIRHTVPAAQETIKYNMPAFTLDKNLVYFAAFKHHIGFYPAPADVPKFKDVLEKYQVGKGSLRFPLNRPLPFEIIGKIAKERLNR